MPGADDLYEVRPEEFVAARTTLAKELRSAGRKDEAASVTKLRRPSLAAWALNQVARRSPAVVEAALEAGAALRAASDEAMAGRPGPLRAATTAERQAANEVVKAAASHLGSRAESLTPTLLATIRVAALDDTVADELRRGVLASDQAQPGFGFGIEEAAAAPAPRPRAKTSRVPKASARGRARPPSGKPSGPSPARKAADKATEAAAAREKAERAAAREAARAHKKELTARQRTAERKAREALRLAKEADEAEAEARTARDAADAAAAAADAARAAVEELVADG
jgi:hypothetical protein